MAISRVWRVENAFARLIWPIRFRTNKSRDSGGNNNVNVFMPSNNRRRADRSLSLALTLSLFPSDDPEIPYVCKSKWNFNPKSDRPPFPRRPIHRGISTSTTLVNIVQKVIKSKCTQCRYTHMRFCPFEFCACCIRKPFVMFDGIPGIEGGALSGAFFFESRTPT